MSKPFRLGLTMAGAVSAGAYTGGVLDYLLQTLDAWQLQKSRNDPSVPVHAVTIDIISGASAGGITGAMAALALHMENRYPVLPGKRDDELYLKKNIFYNAWVNLTQSDMLPVLLNQDDIQKNGKPVSLLNSTFIEQLARETIKTVPQSTTAPPPWVSRDMELIMTLSNLDGFNYELNFASEGSSKHSMKQHRDYAFFRLGKEYRDDGRIPLDLQREDTGLRELLEAAPATGAFPVGLAYRKFVRKRKYIRDNRDLIFYKEGITTMPGITGEDPEGDYVTYNVDGGMLNNEPFDLTMKLMARSSMNRETVENEELEKEEHSFDSTIIMIDPFPSDDQVIEGEAVNREQVNTGASKKEFPQFPYGFKAVIGKIYAAMRGELLFKGEDIVQAFSNEDFSRFMIAPRRRVKIAAGSEDTYNGSVAIACGALGGFAGFFDQSFRRHDFFLGRANCQSFLRKYFRVKLENGVPVNKLFAEGYTAEAIQEYRFQDDRERAALKTRNLDPDDAPWYVPIIPDVHKRNSDYDEEPLSYPDYAPGRIDGHKAALLARAKVVAKSLTDKWYLNLLINIVFLFGGNKIFATIKKTIVDEFISWKLVKESTDLPA